MSVLARQLALVSESRRVRSGDVMKVAAALQKQAVRDLAPIWEISATVDAFERLEHVPVGYWPMIVMDDIRQQGAAGIHLDRDRQPFALITADSSTAAAERLRSQIEEIVGRKVEAPSSPKKRSARASQRSDDINESEDGESEDGLKSGPEYPIER